MRKSLTTLLALLSLPLLGGCQAALFRVVNIGGPSGIARTTATYAPAHDLKLDIYRPANAQAAPVALFFYGGSWRNGDRADYAFVGRALAARGVLTLVADYRTYPQGRFPIFEEDAAEAARWTIEHCADFGGDPRRVFLTGHSAGAQIAALLATDAHYLAAQGLRPRRFAGAIGIAGPYDFLPLTDPKLMQVFGPEKDWPASQPVNFVDGDEPPFLLLQGDDDRIVAPRNAASLAEKLRGAKIAVGYKRYPGLGHLRIIAALRYPSLAPTLDDVVAFIGGTPPSPPPP